jgi:hypothetical protein
VAGPQSAMGAACGEQGEHQIMAGAKKVVPGNGFRRLGKPTFVTGLAVDGRTRRRLRTRDTIIDICRIMMLEGELRPDSRTLAARTGVSSRTLFWHFPKLQEIYREALKSPAVAHAIERRIPRDRAGILRAVVLGELMEAARGHRADSSYSTPPHSRSESRASSSKAQ